MNSTTQQNLKKGFRIQSWVLFAGLILLVVKFGAYVITSSNAILSDALESIINVLAGSIALYSLYLSSKPKDEDHPYGHGKVEFISSGVEGAMIVFAGLVIVFKSVWDLVTQSNEIGNLDIGLAITLGGGLINYFLGAVLIKKGKEYRSAVLKADGEHLKSDAYTSFGLLVGLGIVYVSKVYWLDNVVAIIFAIIIVVMGLRIVRASVRDIMDELDMGEAEKIVDTLNEIRRPEWIDIHNLRIIKFGPSLHIDCHITVPYYFDIKQGHDEIEKLDELMNEKLDTSIEFFVHLDPCLPESCKICSLKNCKVRKFAQVKTVEWELENVLENKKHLT